MLTLLSILLPFNNLEAQNLFLHQNLNTPKSDIPWSFQEHKGRYYFVGTQGYTPALPSLDSLNGFCFKTDKMGNLVQRFDLREVAGEPYVSFESIGIKDDKLYIVGLTGSYYPPFDKVVMNKVMLLVLDTNLALQSLDTFRYDSSTSNVGYLKVVYNNEGIHLGYCGSSDDSFPWYRSFLTKFSYTGQVVRYHVLTTSFLNNHTRTDSNMLIAITPAPDGRLFLNVTTILYIGNRPTNWNTDFGLLLDSNYSVIDSVMDIINLKSNTIFRTISGNYNECWQMPSGRCYVGPLVLENDRSLGIGKLNDGKDSVRITPVLARLDTTDAGHSQAFKQAMLPLSDQRRIVLLGTSNRLWNYEERANGIRVVMYDTSMRLLWQRGFSKPKHSFNTFGIHELSDNRLMVLAAAYDYGNGAPNLYDFYVFVLDSTGAPLSTFNLPSPSQNTVTLYPNPAQNEISFQLPEGSSKAAYLLTDLQGKTVRSGAYFSGNTVSVTALPAALYLYKIQTADGVWHSGIFQKQ